MSWAEVKKINSDLSTPLDKLFKDSFYLYASDNTLFVVTNSEKAELSSKVLMNKTLNYGGCIRLSGKLISNYNRHCVLTLRINGVVKATFINGNGDVLTPFSEDFSVQKGDEISIGLKLNSTPVGEAYAKDVYLRGTIGIGGGIFDE